MNANCYCYWSFVVLGERTGFLQVGPKKWFFPSGFEREAEHFYNFKLRPDDVFVLTFPRSGKSILQIVTFQNYKASMPDHMVSAWRGLFVFVSHMLCYSKMFVRNLSRTEWEDATNRWHFLSIFCIKSIKMSYQMFLCPIVCKTIAEWKTVQKCPSIFLYVRETDLKWQNVS